ncbi:FliG C-terminal domain-containing protein [Paracoccus sp. DMF-8]|uniref:FliG C-terminal domain-containing protein n=1 Tax=Paracoccus sp. DMF-8 TaxID=3019445 RepID=UPI0023E89575|nr:FliG C-terminal domain-containing protein [Paracoccus sp. DMF-8]MDF3605579.1 FliG C-terminal domain-containing protein [Paracoccus sp. DMF-8]
MSLTGAIEAPALRRIGLALVQAADALPRPALPGGPVDTVGAILNYAQSNTRDTVLAGLDSDDAEFAENVRKAIFTWAHIPARIDPRDIPRVVREMDAALMTKALAGARDQNLPTAEFILGALSTRLADSMREEMEGVGKVSAKDAELAMSEVVATIRRLESEDQLIMIAPDAEEE